MITTEDLFKQIVDGDHDSHLTAIERAIGVRKAYLGVTPPVEEPATAADPDLYSFKVGETVRFNHRARPVYLQGLTATVVGHNRTRIVLSTPDRPAYRRMRGAKNLRSPVNIIEKV